jgi:hypothetical protein
MLGREPLPAVTFSTGDVGRTSETVEGSPSPDWPTKCGFEWRPSDGGGLPRPRPSMGGAPDRCILRPSVGSVSVDLRRSTRHGSFRCDISSEWKFNFGVCRTLGNGTCRHPPVPSLTLRRRCGRPVAPRVTMVLRAWATIRRLGGGLKAGSRGNGSCLRGRPRTHGARAGGRT